MLVRRAFYWVQLAAIVLVPGWIVVASAIAPRGLGATDVLVFLSWPALAVAMVVVAALTWSRRAVRERRAVSWTDVAALSVWYAVAICYGVGVAVASRLATGLLGGLLLLVSIAVIGLAVYQLVQAARQRVRTVLAGFDRSAVPVDRYDRAPDARGGPPIERRDPR